MGGETRMNVIGGKLVAVGDAVETLERYRHYCRRGIESNLSFIAYGSRQWLGKRKQRPRQTRSIIEILKVIAIHLTHTPQ